MGAQKFKVGDVVVGDETVYSHWEKHFEQSHGPRREFVVTTVLSNYFDGMAGYMLDDCVWWTGEHLTLASAQSGSSPIRTVTRREIVPGYVDLPNGGEIYVRPQDGEVRFDVEELFFDAPSLRAAAKLFNELADVLDEQKEAA